MTNVLADALLISLEENDKLKAEIEMLNARIVDKEKIDLHTFSKTLDMLPDEERKILAEYIIRLEVENIKLKGDIKEATYDNEKLLQKVELYHTAIDEALERYPYKVQGQPETYSDYNQGWQAAVDFIESMSEDGE